MGHVKYLILAIGCLLQNILALGPESQIILQQSLLFPESTSLNQTSWKDQLPLQDRNITSHWIYLRGHQSCTNLSLCHDLDSALSDEYKVLYRTPEPRAVSLSILNCDDEPVLCHSWLLKAPSLMHISINDDDHDPTITKESTEPISMLSSSTVVRKVPLYKPHDLTESLQACRTPRQQITSLFHIAGEVEKFRPWTGLLNPYTGALGKHGGGLVWGKLQQVSPIELTPQTIAITLLFFWRLVVWKLTPSKNINAVESIFQSEDPEPEEEEEDEKEKAEIESVPPSTTVSGVDAAASSSDVRSRARAPKI